MPYTHAGICAGHAFTHSYTPYTHPLYTFPPLSRRGGNVRGRVHGTPQMPHQNLPHRDQESTVNIDYRMPIPTVARRHPTPEDYARIAAMPIPPRGNAPTPAWFTFGANGWSCDYPHPDPRVLCGISNTPWAASQGLDHLNDHHAGWKLPCTRCGVPQWNESGSLACFRCRR